MGGDRRGEGDLRADQAGWAVDVETTNKRNENSERDRERRRQRDRDRHRKKGKQSRGKREREGPEQAVQVELADQASRVVDQVASDFELVVVVVVVVFDSDFDWQKY